MRNKIAGKSDEWKGYALVLLYAFIGAVYFLSLDYILDIYPEITGIEMAFWSYLGASSVLIPIFSFSSVLRNHVKEDFQKNPPWLIIFIGLLTGVAMIFMAIVLERSTAEMMSIFTNSEIIFTIIIALFWLQEKFTRTQFLGAVVALSGFAMLSSFSNEIDLLSIVLVLLAQMAYAFQNILVKKYSTSLNPFSMSFVRMLFMMLSTIPFYIFTNGEIIPLEAVAVLSFLVILAAFGSRAILYQSFKYIDVSKASVWFLWETIFIILGSYIFFSPVTTYLKILGIVFVLLGVYLVQKK